MAMRDLVLDGIHAGPQKATLLAEVFAMTHDFQGATAGVAFHPGDLANGTFFGLCLFCFCHSLHRNTLRHH